MSNKRTLKPFERGTARARTIGRKGGIASGVARREAIAHGMTPGEWKRQQTFAQAARTIMRMPASGKTGKQGMTYAAAACLKLWQQAQRGSTRSFHLLAMLLGEIPVRKMDCGNAPIIRDDVPRFDLVREIEAATGFDRITKVEP